MQHACKNCCMCQDSTLGAAYDTYTRLPQAQPGRQRCYCTAGTCLLGYTAVRVMQLGLLFCSGCHAVCADSTLPYSVAQLQACGAFVTCALRRGAVP